MQTISSELSLIRKSFSGGFFVLSVELALGKWFFDHFRRARELAWYRENHSLSAQHSNRVIGKLWENFCRQFFFPAVVCVGKRMSGIWKLNKPIFQCPADDDFPSLYDYIVCTWASSLAPSVQCVVKLWQFFSMCFERGRRRKHENVLLNFFSLSCPSRSRESLLHYTIFNQIYSAAVQLCHRLKSEVCGSGGGGRHASNGERERRFRKSSTRKAHTQLFTGHRFQFHVAGDNRLTILD